MLPTLVFTIALNGYNKLFADCIKTQESYSCKFGYKYQLIDRSKHNLSAEDSAWLKIYLLREALKIGYRWIAFIDADCEIRKHTPDFPSYLHTLDPEASTYMAHGFSGRINSGVIFIKNTPQAKAYLNEVIGSKNHPVPKEDKAPYENGHMIKYGKENDSVKIIDNHLWNNNSTFDPESYIQHYSGGILRPLYLQKHLLDTKIYRFKKKWNLRIRRKKSDSNIENLEKIIPWFKNKYLLSDTEFP